MHDEEQIAFEGDDDSLAETAHGVHALAFGQLFESTTTSPMKQAALDFLLAVQQDGKTSSSSDTSIESYKIITGDYNTRIDKIRQALERIMDSGIQVSLIPSGATLP